MPNGTDIIDKQIAEAIARIDLVLDRNVRLVWVVLAMSSVIFIVGAVLLLIGFKNGDWKILTPSALMTGLLYWPINKILTIRKENIQLAVVPALIKTLPPEKAAEQIIKLIEKLDTK
ncbi:hypothetical protein A2982_00480 [candidate division WWE3 bacterium RIFCSPLOWO2_01_FULL_39_13]|uniref:Uncharacterized protein n=1 Tax=candidate division WWE3 bacterium RIFCSPLOWO2_01_FULL_39_13 TaxID=1802624 RepID=A0A1F4V3G8_UNCKA|nr:MAG: hypothetical protein A2982_00480 [candidate division WWE3 bacterium RIFCSPLOWO2_01_FULL_39_13]